ncbi:NAD(H) kinase 1-like [Salvia miltiorrhiza]|uniref:NAD(H) kinase 1-like n=1 Tax=Salvia miltiorrhiza TaxID=226208 RepID=UPI0025AB6A33|nr:NAD(H) kinase 1-like [Salvia miltiorrhiza]
MVRGPKCARRFAEYGCLDSTSVLSSEKSIEELIQQPPLQGIEDNLIEFSEALRILSCARLPIASCCAIVVVLLHHCVQQQSQLRLHSSRQS